METPRERQQRREEAKQYVHSLELQEAYRATFDTPAGRKVLEDLVVRGHMLETTCSGNAWSYFYEGERNTVLRLMSIIPGLVGQVIDKIAAERQVDLNKLRAQSLDEQK